MSGVPAPSVTPEAGSDISWIGQILRPVTAARPLSPVLVSAIVRLVVLSIHSHGVDIVAPDSSKRAAGRLIRKEKRPAVGPLAGDLAGGVGWARKRHAVHLDLAVREERRYGR